MNTIVIQTALVLEQEAVIDKLTNFTDYIDPKTKSIYKVGNYDSNGNNLEIIVGRTNQTNVNAGIETTRVIKQFNPTYMFFLGVAGSLKDPGVGDIVIGTDVVGYERGNQKDEFLSRPQFGFSSYEMEQKAVNYSMSNDWKDKAAQLVDVRFHDSIKVYAGTIASGEKVVASIDSGLYKFIRINFSHALAVEMEGLGFLEACRPYPLIKTLIIRGISDLIEKKEDSDIKGSQPYASQNATEFLFGLIDYLDIKQEIITLTLKQKLAEIATKLYPQGIRESGIWQRAGGDLSLVTLSENGKSQWIQGLNLIENGCGVDFASLIKVMKSDYPTNISLNDLEV